MKSRLLGSTAFAPVLHPLPFLSALAGIHDHGNGFRVAIARPMDLLFNYVGENERAYIVPDSWWVEPVNFYDCQRAYWKAHKYTVEQLKPDRVNAEWAA